MAEQGSFSGRRMVFMAAGEKAPTKPEAAPKAVSEAPQLEKGPEKPSPRAELAEMNAEIGIQKPMREMLRLEKTLTAEGQKAEFTFQNEKVTGTLEKGQVVWRKQNGEIINKAKWLKELVDKANERLRGNIPLYWAEISKKYDKDEKVRKSTELQTEIDLKEAEKAKIYDLQGGWNKVKMTNMFLNRQRDSMTFVVDLKNKDKFENYVGAGDILPPTVTEILVIDKKGNQRKGERKIVNGRVGYYDPGYIPIYSGYTITILKTISEAEAKKLELEEKESENHRQMKGTIWHKSDMAPTEVDPEYVNPRTGYRYANVGGKRVEVKPPEHEPPVIEGEKPQKIEVVENPEFREEIFMFRGRRVYFNVPKNMEKYGGKKPRIVVYFHGNNGRIEEYTGFLTQKVQEMRKNGDPVILVLPESPKGWPAFHRAGSFSQLMDLTKQVAGGAVDPNISIVSHSGGYKAVQHILGNGDEYDRIKSYAALDSTYETREFTRFARDPSKTFRSVYTSHLRGRNEAIRQAIEPEALTAGRVEIRASRVSHGEAKREYFAWGAEPSRVA